MEQYVIDIQILCPTNKKEWEMTEFIGEFAYLLIEGNDGIEELRHEITCKCAELNIKYPKSKSLEIHCFYDKQSVRTSFDTDVFRMSITKIHGVYRSGKNKKTD
jgi:hypothetical protein